MCDCALVRLLTSPIQARLCMALLFVIVEQLFHKTRWNACFRSRKLEVIPKLPQMPKFSWNIKLNSDKNTFQKIETMVSRFVALSLFKHTVVTTTRRKWSVTVMASCHIRTANARENRTRNTYQFLVKSSFLYLLCHSAT